MILSGELSYATVEDALKRTAPLFSAPTSVVFDLSGVERTDSAGLALLLEWRRRARQAGGQLRYAHPPRQMLAMARAAGIEVVLLEESSSRPASPGPSPTKTMHG